MNKTNVSKATLRRYPIYLKAVRKLKADNVQEIMSHELAELVNIKATTIRRDFSLLGNLGKQGAGYQIDTLEEKFNDVLGMNFDEKIILVGVGNLGKALLNYNHWDYVVGEIVCGFDLVVPDEEFSVPIYDINDIEEKMPENCKIAILTASDGVQETVDKLVECGIIGIVDFTHEHINVPEGVVLKPVDVVSTIQEIVFETSDRYSGD